MAEIDDVKEFERDQAISRKSESPDEGFYPSKRDTLALIHAVEQISIEPPGIAEEFAKKLDDIRKQALDNLPESIKRAKNRKRLHDIICKDRDIPFFRTDGEPTGTTENPLDVLTDEYKEFIGKMTNAGWTVPLDIDIRNFKALMASSSDESSLDSFFTGYFTSARVNALKRRISQSIVNLAQRKEFVESIELYERGQYQVCRGRLIPFFESFLPSCNPDINDALFRHVCDARAKEARASGRNIKSLCWLSIYQLTQNLCTQSDFEFDEPETMNCHWTQHGRTAHAADKTECIQLMNALSAIACIIDADKQ